MSVAMSIMHIPADQFFSLYGLWALGTLFVVGSFIALQLRERYRE